MKHDYIDIENGAIINTSKTIADSVVQLKYFE